MESEMIAYLIALLEQQEGVKHEAKEANTQTMGD